MVTREYIPSRGDIIWMPFDPTLGHEQKGNRPALVVSSRDFNRVTGLVYVCPVTSTEKQYAWHIPFNGIALDGFIMVEHMRSIDWRTRKIIFKEKVEPCVLMDVTSAIQAIVL